MDDLLLEYEGSKPSTPTDRARRRRLAATATICGLAFIGIGQLSTGAWFTDSGTANVQFTTGDVQISLDGAAGTSGQPRNLVLNNVNNMAPGDIEYIPIEVTNSGSLQMRYAVTGETSSTPKAGGSPLSDVLEYTVYSGVTQAQCSAGTVGGGTVVSTTADQLLPEATEGALVGDKANGNQAGDRSLPSASNEWLCTSVSLPGASTGNAYAGGTAAVTLHFYAEQTKNNP